MTRLCIFFCSERPLWSLEYSYFHQMNLLVKTLKSLIASLNLKNACLHGILVFAITFPHKTPYQCLSVLAPVRFEVQTFELCTIMAPNLTTLRLPQLLRCSNTICKQWVYNWGGDISISVNCFIFYRSTICNEETTLWKTVHAEKVTIWVSEPT